MASNDYMIDLGTKLIKIPNSRWYETPDGIFPSVTTILSAKAKAGLTSWQLKLAEQGANVKEVGIKNMDEGSNVHDACERIMKGETLKFYNEETETENYKLFEEWLPICRFLDAYKELEIQPILIEQSIWSKTHQFAGTMDLLCTLKPDKKSKERVLAIVDLKRSSGAYTDYHLQLSAYMNAFWEMALENNDIAEYFKLKMLNADINNTKGLSKAYLLLLNVDTKKGWRLTEVENIDQKFELFKACNTLWRGDNPSLEFAQEMYPLELSLEVKSEK